MCVVAGGVVDEYFLLHYYRRDSQFVGGLYLYKIGVAGIDRSGTL
jgi:hypothetical protein